MSSNIIIGGSGIIGDASDSSRRYVVTFERQSNTTIAILHNATGFGLVTNGAPFTWAASDEIRGSITYWTT
jgi:hypothetical protein